MVRRPKKNLRTENNFIFRYSASANERDCLQNCKRSTNCQGQEISKGNVPECIQNCRDQCTKDRKEKISEGELENYLVQI